MSDGDVPDGASPAANGRSAKLGADTQSLPLEENQRFTRRYIVALVLGIVPVFLSTALWWMAIVAMIAFLIAGYEDAKKSRMVYEFADAFYYLGFTLSVGSLLAALDPFHVASRPNVVKTFHQFGLGMFTTLIGVAGRTVLQSYHRLPSETLEDLNRQIADQGRSYLASLTKLNKKTNHVLSSSIAEYEAKILTPLGRFGDALAKGVEVADEAVRHTETLRAAVADASGAIASKNTEVGGSLTALARGANEVNEELKGLTVGLSRAVQSQNGLASAATEAGESLRSASQVVGEGGGRLAETVDELMDTSATIRASADSLRTAQLQVQLAELTKALQSATAGIQEQGVLTRSQAAVLETQLQASRKAAEDINAALAEIVEATTLRLERIQ